MPAPRRTSRDEIVAAARAILETDGLDADTMRTVAARVGVRAPSLYKHVADRPALVRAVITSVTDDLAAALTVRRSSADPLDDLRAIARRYRTFVRANPAGYALLFAHPAPGTEPDAVVLAALGEPIVAATTRIVGEAEGLAAARTFVAWAHGFTSLEGAGGFRLGGDLDAAYADGIEIILTGFSGRATRRGG